MSTAFYGLKKIQKIGNVEMYLQVNLSSGKCALKYSIQRNLCATPNGQERNYNHMSRSHSAPFHKTKESNDLY